MFEQSEVGKAKTVAEMLARDFRLRTPGDLEELFQYFFEKNAAGPLWDQFQSSYMTAIAELNGEYSFSTVLAAPESPAKAAAAHCASISFTYVVEDKLELLDLYIDMPKPQV